MICIALRYIVEGLLNYDDASLELKMYENEMQKTNGTKISDAPNDLPTHANDEGKEEQRDSEDQQTTGHCKVNSDKKQVGQIAYWLMK